MPNIAIIKVQMKTHNKQAGGDAMQEATVDLDGLIRGSEKNRRIDVVQLAKNLGLEVYSVDLPDEDSGCLKKGDVEPFIEVNRNHPVTRQRFTIAHEISHYIKHQDQLELAGKLDRTKNYHDDVDLAIEDEADQTAAEILMPQYLIDDYLKEKDWGKLTKYSSRMIEEIADQFRVSRTMAITRLRGVGIKIPYLSFA
jgi:Zn-dependent peptidase ImmA (M78 family)